MAKDWASPLMRTMMFAIITVAFVCFLRIDEALALQVHEVAFNFDQELELWFMVIHIHHRKNAPLGCKLVLPDYLLNTLI